MYISEWNLSGLRFQSNSQDNNHKILKKTHTSSETIIKSLASDITGQVPQSTEFAWGDMKRPYPDVTKNLENRFE